MTSPQADNPGVIALPPVLYGGAFLLAVVLQVLQPWWIVPWLAGFLIAVLLLAAGGALAFWGARSMRHAGTNVNPHLPTTALVLNGPFRFSRNPLYLSLTLFYLGLTFAVNTLWGLLLLIPLLVVMHYGVIKREERYLEAKFGDAYRTYRAKVRRWL